MKFITYRFNKLNNFSLLIENWSNSVFKFSINETGTETSRKCTQSSTVLNKIDGEWSLNNSTLPSTIKVENSRQSSISCPTTRYLLQHEGSSFYFPLVSISFNIENKYIKYIVLNNLILCDVKLQLFLVIVLVAAVVADDAYNKQSTSPSSYSVPRYVESRSKSIDYAAVPTNLFSSFVYWSLSDSNGMF